MARRVRLDHKGIAEILKSDEVALALGSLADNVQASAQRHEAVLRHDATVEVEEYETDRVAFAVTIAHAGGQGIEAKHGVLTQSAAQAGLEVRSRQ